VGGDPKRSKCLASGALLGDVGTAVVVVTVV
jgi:hypothetical protein